uniref:LITAF domain-containing protein n=1 Tax=Bombyx mori TaxID=7091 RepID=A0A8R2M0H2_BOMMO|nr:lipopolysaccharide-induced tumor necrosis factor-alpha factor homolog [Bombyx mori]
MLKGIVNTKNRAVMNVVPIYTRRTKDACPSCRTVLEENVETEIAIESHLIVILLLSMLLSCLPLPVYVSSCKHIDHYCPNSKVFFISYKYYWISLKR